jgi:MFS family permease
MAMSADGRRGWYYGWNIVAVCVLAGIAASALPINAFSLFLHDWSAQLHTPISTLQLGIGCCGLGCALLAPFVGVLADKYPGRWLFAIGLFGMALFCVAISYVTAVWQYVALYAALLPVSLLFSTSLLANAVVSRWFVKRLGLALSITAFGLGMAGVVMPPIIAATMPDFGWRAIWRCGGILIAVLILPLVIAVLRDRPTERDGLDYLQGQTTGNGQSTGTPQQGAGSSGLRWRDIFARRNFWLLVIVYIPMLAVYGGAGQNIAPIAASRGLSADVAGVLLSLLNLSQLAATLVVGLLSDRFGNRLPLAGLAFATALGGALVAFANGAVLMGLGIVLAGCGGAFWPLIAAAIAVEFGASDVGRVFGLVTFFLPATVLAPFAVAKSQEMGGSYAPALLVMTALAVIGGTACGLLMRERRVPRPDAGSPAAVEAPVGTTP